eukprot:1788242-Pyramimonas_sp.AAC.1
MARIPRIEWGSFSKCGSRLSAARILFNHLQELLGLRAAPYKNVVLASAPRAFVFNNCQNFTYSQDQRTRNGLEGFRNLRAQVLR